MATASPASGCGCSWNGRAARPSCSPTTQTDADGAFTVSVRIDPGRKLRGSVVLHSDPSSGQSAGTFTIGRVG